MQKKGNKYGTHRVIEPQGLLTQAAKKIDNTMECWSNEILCDVSAARCRTLSPAPAACSSAPSRRSARICRARST